jgi:DNA-binding NarL/FixJ family response regulator
LHPKGFDALGIDDVNVRGLKKRLPNLEVVMLTAYEEEDNIFRALKEGASGYLIKSSNSNDILEAIIKYLS